MIPLMNAAGMVKSAGDILKLMPVPEEYISQITTGSYTPKAREGNKGKTYSPPLNALGMPNPGVGAVAGIMQEVEERFPGRKKPIRASIAGFSLDDYVLMAQDLKRQRLVRTIELNLGCPNVGGEHPGIFSFNPGAIAAIVTEIHHEYEHDPEAPEIALKLSPYSDPGLREAVFHTITQCPKGSVREVVLSNTYPDAFGFEDGDHDGKPLLGANDGFGGLSGPSMKHIALGQVAKARKALPDRIRIVGVGGVSTARDVRDMERAGASAVQIGLAFFETMDPRIFQGIAVEYAETYGML